VLRSQHRVYDGRGEVARTNAGGFNGFGVKADGDDSDSEDGYSAKVLDSMTLQEKSDAYEAMLAEYNRKRA
jgi:hypothetical protein